MKGCVGIVLTWHIYCLSLVMPGVVPCMLADVLHRRPPELLVTTSYGPQYTQEFVTFYDHTLCQEVAMHAQEDMVEVVTRALEQAQMSRADVDFLVTHRPVAWAADAWRAGLGMPQEKLYASFAQYGNVACASVPVNLLEALEKHLIAAGDRAPIVSSGVGENHIALVEKISPQLIQKTNNARGRQTNRAITPPGRNFV